MEELKPRGFDFYMDHLQTIIIEDFPTILSEAGKFRLNIAGMANQFIAQLPSQLASAILGNVGTLIAFTCGSEDAEMLAREFYPVFNSNDLLGLPKYNTYMKISVNGSTSDPFSAETLPALKCMHVSNREYIIARTRQRYCQPRQSVETKVQSWMHRQ
ncbi:MAG: hypothetical protein IPH75_14650 [bacterium]|nr:hypothetical protein [bacterium]